MMKHRIKSHIILTVLSFAMVFLVILIIGLIYLFWYLSLDKSAEFAGNTMHWKGKSYIEVSGRYNVGDTIAKTTDGDWNISEVEGDTEHNFIEVRSFLNQYLYVNEDYEIPTDGEITSVYVDYKKIADSEFCNAVKQIIKDSGETFEYETDNIYSNTEDIYLCYENCAVGTEFAGNIGVINNQWVYFDPQQETYAVNEDGSRKSVTITCTIIDEKYTEILQKNTYFKTLMKELQDSGSKLNVSDLNISQLNTSKVIVY